MFLHAVNLATSTIRPNSIVFDTNEIVLCNLMKAKHLNFYYCVLKELDVVTSCSSFYCMNLFDKSVLSLC